MKNTNSPKRINQKQLVRIFKDIKGNPNSETRFCFLIGAGASKSSGIPTGRELSKDWYADLKEDLEEEELANWQNNLKENKDGELVEIEFDEEKIEYFYTHLYQKRFEASPELGYAFFKKIMESVDPSLGYVILSQILAKEKHNFVITTNFDYLIEDAVRMYTSTKPFVAGHELLAEFISSQTDRPTIVKVHRDLFLHPINDDEGTSKLKEEWKKTLEPILKNFPLLIIGYGGNDGSLMDYLKEIPAKERKPIYWCIRNEDDLNDKISTLLTDKDQVITIGGFDELMYSLNDALGYDVLTNLDKPDEHDFVKAAKERLNELQKKKSELLENYKDNKDIPPEINKLFTGPMEVILEANLESDNDRKEAIYQKGIEQYPENARLLAKYSVFLFNIKKYEEVGKYFHKAIELDPTNATYKNNYAVFLQRISKNYDEAEKYFQKSIELDPQNVRAICNYAVFLQDIRKNYSEAEKYYCKAMLAPNDGEIFSPYAHYLIIAKEDFQQAAEYINKALKIDNQELHVLAKLWFYRYAHYEQWFEEGEKALIDLVDKGAKAIGFNSQAHIDIAKKNGTSDIKKLEAFAKQITE